MSPASTGAGAAQEGATARSVEGGEAGNERDAWDSYRRLVQMYGDLVTGLKPASKADDDPFEVIIDMVRAQRGVTRDTESCADDLEALVARFRALMHARIGCKLPTDPWGLACERCSSFRVPIARPA